MLQFGPQSNQVSGLSGVKTTLVCHTEKIPKVRYFQHRWSVWKRSHKKQKTKTILMKKLIVTISCLSFIQADKSENFSRKLNEGEQSLQIFLAFEYLVFHYWNILDLEMLAAFWKSDLRLGSTSWRNAQTAIFKRLALLAALVTNARGWRQLKTSLRNHCCFGLSLPHTLCDIVSATDTNN